jgi:hypothetical protein
MKFKNDIERSIYAACYVTRLGGELGHSRPSSFTSEEWSNRAVDLAIGAAETVVMMHREGMARR